MIRRADFSHRSRVVDQHCHIDVGISDRGRFDAENDLSTVCCSTAQIARRPAIDLQIDRRIERDPGAAVVETPAEQDHLTVAALNRELGGLYGTPVGEIV